MGCVLVLTLFLVACSKKSDQDKVAEAQNCLDGATSATFQTCVDMVQGLETKAAYTIRCIGKFVEEGFNESTRLSSAMNNLSSSGSSSQTLSIMAVMAFQKNASLAVNTANAQAAMNYCSQGNSKGLTMLSMLSSVATTAAEVANLTGNLNSTNLQAAMASIAANPTASTAVGNAVLAAYQANCTSGATTAGGLCTQLSSAVGSNTNNPQAIGQAIATCYGAPSTPGCTGF